jgi:hypothetical protein
MEIILTHRYRDFNIQVLAEQETDIPEHLTESEKNLIKSGGLLLFRVMVGAHKHGILLGSSILSGCCYRAYADFLSTSCYFDMIEKALNEADKKIKLLFLEKTTALTEMLDRIKAKVNSEKEAIGIKFSDNHLCKEATKNKWQPISTAPKDGTWILAINADVNGGRIIKS